MKKKNDWTHNFGLTPQFRFLSIAIVYWNNEILWNQGVGVEAVTAQFNLTYDGSMADMCQGKDYGIKP